MPLCLLQGRPNHLKKERVRIAGGGGVVVMASQEDDDDDDIDVNHFTVLFQDNEEEAEAEAEVEAMVPAAENEATQQLQQHYISSINSRVVIRQLISQGLSFQLWPAATTLVNLLDNHRSHPSTCLLTPTLSAALPNGRNRLRMLELGSGTGLVGIAAAAALGADVTVTDLPNVLPNLQFNVDANSKVLAQHGGRVNVAPLGWGEADQMEAIGREFDLIVGSDVVYHDHLYEPLLRTLRFFMVEGKQRMVFVMAHLRRWKKESAFFKRARKAFNVEAIHSDSPSDGARVGVVVYRFEAKRQNANVASN